MTSDAKSTDSSATRGGASLGFSRRRETKSSLLAHGQPMLWLTAGALVLCLLMIAGLLLLVLWQGGNTFWPGPIVEVTTLGDRRYLGEVHDSETYRPEEHVLELIPEDKRAQARAVLDANKGESFRRMLRTGNFEQTGSHFNWVSDFETAQETLPPWAVVLERQQWGRFYGTPSAFLLDNQVEAEGPDSTWALFEKYHPAARSAWEREQSLKKHEAGEINRQLNNAKLAVVAAKLTGDPARLSEAEMQFANVEEWAALEQSRLNERIQELQKECDCYKIIVTTSRGTDVTLRLADIVRGYPANSLSWFQKLGIYLSRWWEFLSDKPREANSEGGVLPAIWGTVTMTLLMSLAVVPFGVMAALYLREYSSDGFLVRCVRVFGDYPTLTRLTRRFEDGLVSSVRIAVNNLAGVPSIVFGVFGLGFFCYLVGGSIDDTFFSARKVAENKPTFGTGGVLWASLTLALLTLPVVIVATEEALAAVPRSMREGSYACGASKWQTIRRIVLPRAMPGIMTGMILAMARGAGEVAPLMLVGAAKTAPELPVDGVFPYVHLERSFMHLGFHIYDVGLQSQNSEAAKPLVFTTTLLLIAIVALLNIFAVWLRTRLRRRFVGEQF